MDVESSIELDALINIYSLVGIVGVVGLLALKGQKARTPRNSRTLAFPPKPVPTVGLESSVGSWRQGNEQEAFQGGRDREQAA